MTFNNLLNLCTSWSKNVVKLGNKPFSLVQKSYLCPKFKSNSYGTSFLSNMPVTISNMISCALLPPPEAYLGCSKSNVSINLFYYCFKQVILAFSCIPNTIVLSSIGNVSMQLLQFSIFWNYGIQYSGLCENLYFPYRI